MLEKIDLKLKLSKEDYKTRLPALRNRLYDLQKACWEAGIGSLTLFEGWDASGKGKGTFTSETRKKLTNHSYLR